MYVDKDIGVDTLIMRGRNAKGWTQKELAERIGVSTALVGRWETGDVPVTRRNAELVAEALDIDRETIVTKAFVRQAAQFRSRNQRVFQREYANYPEILRLVESMRNCPKCSYADRELEDPESIDTNLLTLALDNMEAGIYIRDMVGNILYANEHLAKMFLTDKESLLGQDIRLFGTDPILIEERIEQLMKQGSVAGKAEAVRRDNTRLPIVYWCYVIKDAYGNPVGVIGLIHTIDACKEIIDQIFADL